MQVKASFQNIEDYEIKIEATMNYAQWKILLQNIDRQYIGFIGEFVEPIRTALNRLEEKVLVKPEGDAKNVQQ